MDGLTRISLLALPVLLTACVSIPSGPSITSLPGTGKSFDQFRADDLECRQYASNTVGGNSPAAAQTDSAVKSGAVGAVVGGLAGAALGGSGEGAAAGAGVGLLVGAMAGSEAATTSGYNVQRRYDSAYVQCMYARGNRVPMATAPRSVSPRPRYYPPSASGPYYPPPPSGYESAQAPTPPRGSAPPGAPSSTSDRLFVYPRSGQSEAQTASDFSECGRWATNQSGYDASRPNPADPRRSDYQRAISACLDGRGYTVR